MAKLLSALKQRDRDILQAQSITEDSPGSILKDFATLLDFIGPRGIEVSGKYHLLPMKRLPELNSRLSNPVELDLKRPQQKSYPHIHGLYLVLRASGLAIVKQRGKKHWAELDEQGVASWRRLNPTERYFTLLESWLMRGDPSVLGEDGLYANGSIGNWPLFCERFLDQSVQVSGNPEVESLFHYLPSPCTLALLELFGLLAVQHAKPELGKGWRVARIERTALGDAMLRLFTEEQFFLEPFSSYPENESAQSVKNALGPLFPEWQHNLKLTEPERLQGRYVFKVAFNSIWARIAISSGSSLDELSAAILNAYEFDFDHLYRFTYTDRFGKTVHINHPYVKEPPVATEVTIADLGLTPGTIFTYLYDFGDMWQFDVALEQIEPSNRNEKPAKLIEFHGERPAQYGDYNDDW